MASVDNPSGVASVNGRTGSVSLISQDITDGLGFAPVKSVNGITGDTTTAVAMFTSTPISGGTVNLVPASAVSVSIINPAGLLLALNMGMADGFMNGQIHFVVFSKAITAITLLGTNLAVTVGLPTAIALGGTLGFVWDTVITKWTRFL